MKWFYWYGIVAAALALPALGRMQQDGTEGFMFWLVGTGVWGSVAAAGAALWQRVSGPKR